jgi:hypothetical protein
LRDYPQLDVLSVIRAPLEQYPPSVNQVALLAEGGLRVGVVEAFHADYREVRFNGVHPVVRIRAGQHVQSHKEKLPGAFVRAWRALLFQQRTRRAIRSFQPKVVIAYDPNAMAAAGKVWKEVSRPKSLFEKWVERATSPFWAATCRR